MKLTVGRKLIGGFLTISLLLVVSGLFALSGIANIDEAANVIVVENIPLADLSMESMVNIVAGRDMALGAE